MKKLMFAAATAAMIGGVSAAEYYDGGDCGEEGCKKAYTVTVTLKTTMPDAKTKKVAKNDCDDPCAADEYTCTLYYKQGTLKLAGLAWGEGLCDDCDLELGDEFAMWSTSTKAAIDTAALNLQIGSYDKSGKKAEAYGTLISDDGINVMLAGFGTLKTEGGEKRENKCDEPEEFCSSYVKSLSGNAAGFIARDFFDYDPDGIYGDCEAPEGCCGDLLLENAAASGTWKVSYNSSASKKLAKGLDITEAYKFPKYIDLDDAYGEVGTEAVLIEE